MKLLRACWGLIHWLLQLAGAYWCWIIMDDEAGPAVATGFLVLSVGVYFAIHMIRRNYDDDNDVAREVYEIRNAVLRLEQLEKQRQEREAEYPSAPPVFTPPE